MRLECTNVLWSDLDWIWQWSQDPPQSLERAFTLAQRAIALDDSLPGAHIMLGLVYLGKKQHEQAIAEVERAVTLDPNGADGYAGLGFILNWTGRPEEAIMITEKALRLNPHDPHDPFNCPYILGHAYRLTGRYEEAIAALKGVLTRNPDFLPVHTHLAAAYSELGREAEARAEAAEILRISPHFSLDAWRQILPYKDQAEVERYLAGLRKAGLK